MQHVLQDLGEHSADIFSNVLDVGKLSRRGVECRALACGLVGLDTLLQARVVQFSAHVQRGLQPLTLLAVGIQSKLERLSWQWTENQYTLGLL